MIRHPRTEEETLAWWRAALSGAPPAFDDFPEPGFYLTSLIRHGLKVPARIWVAQSVDPDTSELDNDEIVQAEILGREVDPYDLWLFVCSHPISREFYDYLSARIAFAQEHEPDDPFATPEKPVDRAAIPTDYLIDGLKRGESK